MQKVIFSIFILLIVININSDLLAYDFSSVSGNIGNPISAGEKGFFTPLVNIYNQLIELTKNTIDSNMRTLVKSATKLLTTMAFIYIVVIIAKSWITGSYFFSDITIKIGSFLGLSILLQFNWFDKYILSNLESLFNNLPTIFNSNGGSAVENIVNQTASIADKIWTAVEDIGWGLNIIAGIIGIISMITLASLTLIVLLNVLILTVEFYFVLSLSSIWILLFFFKFTRSLSMGAVQVVFGAILKITMLSFFLNLYGGIIKVSLVFKGEDEFFSACMGVILISVIGVVLVKMVNEIANRITGGVGQLAGANMPNLMNTAKGLMGGK